MERSSNNQYAALLTPQDYILFSAVTAKSFQEIADQAQMIMKGSIIIADSLHYILALTADLQSKYGKNVSWIKLIEEGYVPPVATALPPDRPILQPKSLSVEPIEDILIIHDELSTTTGMHCTMCDILDGGSTILKLAITTKNPLKEKQKKALLTLATSLHLAYFRLGTRTDMNDKGRYLLDLIQTGAIPETNQYNLNGFDVEGEFQLICFETRHLGIHNLSFITRFANIIDVPHMLYSMVGDQYVLLINIKYNTTQILEHLDLFSKERNFPIVLSPIFTDLKETKRKFYQNSNAAILAIRFHGARGLKNWKEYSIFLMFEQVRHTPGSTVFLAPEVDILYKHDCKKNTEYIQTLYCYLLHNCDAPETAKALFIHRNTLDKRLQKIEELISINFKNVYQTHLLLYSLFVLIDDHGMLEYYSIETDTNETWDSIDSEKKRLR